MIFCCLGLPQFICLPIDGTLVAFKHFQLLVELSGASPVLFKYTQKRKVSSGSYRMPPLLWDPAKLSLEVTTPFCIPTNHKLGFHPFLLQPCLGFGDSCGLCHLL